MPNTIAFFPWVSTEEIIALDGIRLIPYVRGSHPENLPNASLNDIDGVLSAYHIDKVSSIYKATLMEIDEWQLGLDAEKHVHKLFRAKELIAFSALSNRQLFRRWRRESNNKLEGLLTNTLCFSMFKCCPQNCPMKCWIQ